MNRWERTTLAALVEREIMSLPNAAMIDGKPVAPGQYAATLVALLEKLREDKTTLAELLARPRSAEAAVRKGLLALIDWAER